MRGPLTSDLRAFVNPDSHSDERGFYTVRSLYLDSRDWSCYHDKTAGLASRHKLRIRGYPDSERAFSAINFEVKYRRGGRISKDVARLNQTGYRALLPSLCGALMPDEEWLDASSSLRTFFALKQTYAMSPVVNIQFRRQAFVARGDRRIRVTFDDALVARGARDLRDTMRSARPLLTGSKAILEIKLHDTLPFWLQHLIRKYHLRNQALSKYAYAAGDGPFGLDGTF